MKQEVSTIMKKWTFIFLTCLSASLISPEIYSASLKQIKAKTHMRWSVDSLKDQLNVQKKGNLVIIKTLNMELFESLKFDLQNIKVEDEYIRSIRFDEPSEQNNLGIIRVSLLDSGVELFSFYRDREKKYILDFWSDKNDENARLSSLTKRKTSKKIKKQIKAVASVKKVSVLRTPASIPVVVPVKKEKRKKLAYRDFRYGAAFIWNYKGLSPTIANPLDITRKTPELFYPIKNREYEKSEKEAHLQLSINMYRKEKWGLMYKSITLFQQKYGDEEYFDLNEYMKANAIVRENFKKGITAPTKMAINMYRNIGEKTKIYELRKAIHKYLFSYHYNNKNYVKCLEISKHFFVDSKENFDYEESGFAIEGILFGLAKLKQVKEIEAVVKDKTVKKIISAQLGFAYESYALLELGEKEKLVKLYQQRKSGLAKPIHPSILFNVGEAFFQLAKYKEAVKMFDSFVRNYTQLTESGKAQLRMALSYDLLGKNLKEVSTLYRNAIDHTSDFATSFEARMRFSALTSIRKIKIGVKEQEYREFFTIQKEERRLLSADLKKQLWLVRLRSFIVDKKYHEALSYLHALPLSAMGPFEKRVFESDGAEIIYGLLLNNFKKGEYGKVVKIWEAYKEKYIMKVASDPYLNFIVGRSFIKLGLYKSFEKIYGNFSKLLKTPSKTFPLWIKREMTFNHDYLLSELKLIKSINLKNWNEAKEIIIKLRKNRNNNKLYYYEGIVDYRRNNYKDAIKSFETFLAKQKDGDIEDEIEISDLLLNYTDAIYQSKDLAKYKKVSNAILVDTKNIAKDNPYMKKVKEKIEYLNIEIVSSEETKESSLLLEGKIKNFLNRYKESIYTDRLNYLLGLSLVQNKKVEEGKKIFGNILNRNNTDSAIKELVKTELSLLKIKERTL